MRCYNCRYCAVKTEYGMCFKICTLFEHLSKIEDTDFGKDVVYVNGNTLCQFDLERYYVEAYYEQQKDTR